MTAAILAAAAALAVGLVLRLRIGWLRRLYVPAAAVGGVVGLVALQAAAHSQRTALVDAAHALATQWSAWPGTLIAVVFAGLLLEKPRDAGLGDALRRGTQSAVLAWIIILGQIVIGLVVYVVAVRPAHPEVPATFGQLLEVSWAGGPGSAAGMGAVYAGQGFAAGRDLAFFLCTVGLIYGVVSGLVYVNLAVRRGWIAKQPAEAIGAGDASAPTATALPSAVIEPLAVQVIVLAAAFAAGLLLQRLFLVVAGWVLGGGRGGGQVVDAVGNVPLFLFTLLGGWCVRRAMGRLGIGDRIDMPALQRLLGVAMEFLIVAGIATVRIDALGAFVGPILLLLAGAAVWSAVCLLVLSRPLLPGAYWFELGLLNYGFSTANTPQGLMLLRIIDPHLHSGAAEDYAVAAPLSAPFVGGGIVTFVVLPLVLRRVDPVWVTLVLVVLIGGLIVTGLRLARPLRA